MPAAFDILSRKTPIYASRLIEASAGTGKTFTMEHLIVRFLLEEEGNQPPPTIKEILAVTFTRAAVRDMKQRLHKNLQQTLCFLNQTESAAPPDYLLAILERGERSRLEAARRIESALNAFEEASLYTLHGFCAHTLSENPQTALERFSEDPVSQQIHRIIRHFFRTELHENACHPAQLQKALSLFRSNVSQLEHALIQTLSTGIPVASTFSFSEGFERFSTAMQAIQQHGPFSAEKVLADWHILLPRFKQLRGKPAEEFTQDIDSFTKLLSARSVSLEDFGDLLQTGLPLAECEEKARQKPLPHDALFYPELPHLLRTHLLPLIEECLHPERIFAWMASRCQTLWKNYLKREGGGGPDRLIEQTVSSLKDPLFVENVRSAYRVVLVDEFQDTDPLQWELIEKLFLHKKPLILVGDPKQSIYAFRRADLYTYYKAAAALTSDTQCSLLVNYRSDKPLVDALNALFSQEHTPNLFDLPKLDRFIPYPLVQSSEKKREASLKDGGASIEIFLHQALKGRKKTWPTEEIERHYFLPLCIQEIISLHTNSSIPFSEIAILVKDRHQAAYVHEELTKANLPAFIQKRRSILQSDAWNAWKQWMEAMLFPEEISLRHQALTGLFLRCPQEAVTLQTPDIQPYLQYMAYLRDLLTTKGLSEHAETLFFIPHQKGEESLFTYLLRDSTLHELAEQLQHILELMLQHQAKTHCSLYGLLTFLCTSQERLLYDEPLYQARLSAQQHAISIVTMHMSKGLEFDIVFSLGTARRGGGENLLLHDTTTKPSTLRPYSQDDSLYQEFALESDAEKIRHAYVAMTRAKKRLYLTYAIPTDGSSLTLGQAAPLDLLFARLAQPPAKIAELYPRLNSWQGVSLCAWVDKQREKLSIRYRFVQEPLPLQKFQPFSACLKAPNALQITLEPSHTLSYTQCVKVNVKEKRATVTQTVTETEDLPEGKETGILLHHLLAILSWQKLSAASTIDEMTQVITPLVKEEKWQPWIASIASLFYHALNAELPILPMQTTLRLKDVHPSMQSREMPFLYPDQNRPQTLHWKGSVDLFFSHAGLYYLVDWKSHRLTQKELDEDQIALKQKIEEEGLLLQAMLYTRALKNYLKHVDKRPFEECFGGFAFLFLRALHQDHAGRGVILYSEDQLQEASDQFLQHAET